MPRTNAMTDIICRAAAALTAEGQRTFSSEALAIAAYNLAPAQLGLKGFANHVDNHKVLSHLCGGRSLVARGFLRRVDTNLYAAGDGLAIPIDSPLPREQEAFLVALLESAVWASFAANRQGEITFGQACGFWAINDGMTGRAVSERLDVVPEVLALVAHRAPVTVRGRLVAEADVRVLGHIHSHLRTRFERQLNAMVKQGDRREAS